MNVFRSDLALCLLGQGDICSWEFLAMYSNAYCSGVCDVFVLQQNSLKLGGSDLEGVDFNQL